MKDMVPTRRRRFLKTAGALATGASLAGCSTGRNDDAANTNTATGTPGGDSQASVPAAGNAALLDELGLSQPAYDLEGELNVYQWVEYWPEQTVADFEEAFGITVNVDLYESNEEMYQTLQDVGTDAYDVVFPSDYMVSQMVDDGMVQPLDLDKIPNWSNLKQRWIDDAPYDPGSERYSAPYQWGTTGIAWNKELIDAEELTSWDALWNEQYAGQMFMLDDVREAMAASLKRLGYSLNTQNPDEIEEAKNALVEQKQLLRGYDSTNMSDNLVDKRGSPIQTWSGAAFIAYWQTYEDGSAPIGYRIPEEGGVVWIDTAAITADAKHPNAAHAFLNYVLAAKVNAAITNFVFYATPNEAAEEHVSSDILDNPSIYPSEDVLSRLEFIEDVGDAAPLYEQAWQEIQNA